MYIHIIDFNMEISEEEFDQAAIEGAPIFAEVEGLIVKNMLFNHETKTYGGCYMWETKEAMEAYKAGEIFQSIVENPDYHNVTSKEFVVHMESNKIQEQLKNS